MKQHIIMYKSKECTKQHVQKTMPGISQCSIGNMIFCEIENTCTFIQLKIRQYLHSIPILDIQLLIIAFQLEAVVAFERLSNALKGAQPADLS